MRAPSNDFNSDTLALCGDGLVYAREVHTANFSRATSSPMACRLTLKSYQGCQIQSEIGLIRLPIYTPLHESLFQGLYTYHHVGSLLVEVKQLSYNSLQPHHLFLQSIYCITASHHTYCKHSTTLKYQIVMGSQHLEIFSLSSL